MARGGAGRRLALAAALASALAACSGSPLTSYDLSAARPAPLRAGGAPIRVVEPTAALDLDSDRILVRDSPQTLAVLAGARWADRLPALVQMRLIQSFENARLAQAVTRGAGSAAFDLDLDLRAFELDAPAKTVRLDIAAKLVSRSSGRAVATSIFTTSRPVESTSPEVVAPALDALLKETMTRIVAFAATRR